MVHDKEDIQKKRNKNLDSKFDVEYKETGLIQPEWKIDDDGIPYCKKQTEYEDIIKANIKKRFPHEFEKMLNCKRCDHYKNDNCYFPKSEIDKIEEDRQNLHIRCQLCGMKIDRPFSIMMSLFYKDKYNVDMPVICCSCYSGLENGTFTKNSKRRMLLFGISLFTSIYFIISYFSSIAGSIFNWVGIILVILPFSFWGYILTRDIKNIYYLHKGRKYYDKLMNAPKIEKKTDRRDEMMDDDDKKKPAEGAYDSSVY